MSIRKWKRIITLAVILIILSLSAAAIFTGIRYHRLEKKYESMQNSGTLIDLTEYGNIDAEEVDSLLHYLGAVDTNSNLDYQTKFPDLYVENDFIYEEDTSEKVCYLTFDDGPHADITASILDTLKKYDVKATFFVVYRDSKEHRALYKRIVEEGHTIAVHSASHKYNKIYRSVDAFLDDFDRISRQIEESTGVKPEIFRFPGGSVNEYNKHLYQELIAEMIRRGYTYYDWNASCGDAGGSGVSASKIIDNSVNTNTNQHKKVLLMHDGSGHANTAAALPKVIEGLQKQGYTLKPLNKEVSPVTFGY